MPVPELPTERLLLRAFRPADRVPFAALNADREVVRWVGPGTPLSRVASDALIDRVEADWRARGFGLWAVEERAGGAFLGFAGLAVPWFLPAVLPAVEVGWRLARGAWGHGYATEAGVAVLRHAFGERRLAEVVATIFPENARSVRVAEKLGLRLTGRHPHPAARRDVSIYRASAPAQPAGNFSGS